MNFGKFSVFQIGRSVETTNRMEPPPNDPYNLVFIIFYWLGIGSLLPWNFFIAVSAYWMYKFRNVSADPNDEKLSELQLEWNSYLSVAAMIPNVTFLLLNAVFGHRFPTKPRLFVSLVAIIILFIFTDLMTLINTDEWQTGFLAITIATVVLINIMVAIFQGGLAGVAGKFPPAYMGAVVQGQALGGIFAAATNVLMLAFGADSVTAAFYDFLIAVVFLCTALFAFLVLMSTKFFKFYTESPSTRPGTEESSSERREVGKEKEVEEEEEDKLIEEAKVETIRPRSLTILQIILRIWIWIVAVFLCFLVTLSVFPAITSLAQSTSAGKEGSAWSNKYFIPVGCFLLFNVGDFVGRFVSGLVQWPKNTHFGSLIMLGASIARVAFIPLFLFCNVSPNNRHITEVYIYSDTAYLLFITLFSISNGYIGSICMMFGPKMLENSTDQSRAASILISCLVSGLAIGAAMSGLLVKML